MTTDDAHPRPNDEHPEADDEFVRFDPHVHTTVSYDAVGSVREVLDAAREAGLDAIAITDHDAMGAIPEALVRADAFDLTVVPGVEISTAAGHLLGLGITDLPPIGASVAETVTWVRDRGGVAVVPHPFQRSRHGIRKGDMPDADGIEIFNAWSMTGAQNVRARAYASRVDAPCVGGSDAHDPRMVGRAYTDLAIEGDDGPPAVADVLDAIREGRTGARGSTATAVEYVGKVTRSLGIKTRSTVERRLFGAENP